MVHFDLQTMSTIGCPVSRGGSSLEACTALEELLLPFPNSNIQFQRGHDQDRRVEFWSPVVKSAFPRLDEQGRLTFLQSKSNLIHLCHRQLTVETFLPKPPFQVYTSLATNIL